MAGQQHDTDSFVDLVKQIEAFPATECACERLFCQLCYLVGDVRHQMSDSMIIDLLVIRTRIIWPNATQIKGCAVWCNPLRPRLTTPVEGPQIAARFWIGLSPHENEVHATKLQ
jgi:hypothetical protein